MIFRRSRPLFSFQHLYNFKFYENIVLSKFIVADIEEISNTFYIKQHVLNILYIITNS